MAEQLELPFPVRDCWDLIERAPLQVTCKVSVTLQLQVLREIASFLLKGKQCFASDENFAIKFRVSIAQIKNTFRALRVQGVVNFFEQPRAGMRGRGSRAKLKVIDWGQLSVMVDQRLTSDRPTANQHTDQRLTSDRPTANQHTDQRLTSDRPTANQHTDQRLTISRNSSVTTKELTTTEQEFVSFLMDLLTEAKLDNPERTLRTAQQMCLGNDQIQERIKAWFALPERQRIPGMLNNWLTTPGSWESDRRTRSIDVGKTSSQARENTLQLWQKRQDRLQRHKEYQSEESTIAIFNRMSQKGSGS